jgi:hypothetical protein
MRVMSNAVIGLVAFSAMCCQSSLASSLSFSYTGNFIHDDDLQLLYFTVDQTTAVSFQTLSYAGGTNGAGASIGAGGFDPVLSLFKYSGDRVLLGANDDGGCGQAGSDGGACLDSFFAASLLTPGNYVLALTESPNTALGPTLADGFALSGGGDFTCSMFLGTSGPFCDSTLRQRDGHWAVDILGADGASLLPPPSFSFAGNFTQDDQISLYDLQLLQAATVTIRTLSYAGGVNADSLFIGPGGFDPLLSLFDASGAQFQLGASDDGGCFDVPADTNGACHDSLLISPLLSAGNYRLALTQSPNFALGPTLSDGFAFSGAGDFTCSMFLGTSGSFCDSTLSQRDGHFAFDLYGADSVTKSGAAPEPASFLLVLTACAAGMLRRRNTSTGPGL